MVKILTDLEQLFFEDKSRVVELDIKKVNYQANRSIRALLKMLFKIPLDNQIKPLLRAYLDTQLMTRSAEMILALGYPKLSSKLFHKAFIKARKFSFVPIAHQCLRQLMVYYSNTAFNGNQSEQYTQLYKEFQKLRNAEEAVELIYCSIKHIIKLEKRKSLLLNNKLVELDALTNSSTEFNFQRYYYYSLITIYEHKNDKKLIQVCKAAISYFEQSKIPVPSNYIFFCYYNLLPYLIKIQAYQDAADYLEKCKIYSISSHINQSITRFYYILNLLHQERYQEAHSAFQYQQNIKTQYQRLKEFFLLLDGYFEFLRLIGKVDFERKKQFRITTFFNNLDKLSKDKGQMNINIRLLRMLLLLAQGKKMQLIEESEALRTYTVGLKKVKHIERIRYFLHIMGTIERTSFHPIAFARHTEAWHKKLTTTPLSENAMSLELEIIPFEKLYKYVQKTL